MGAGKATVRLYIFAGLSEPCLLAFVIHYNQTQLYLSSGILEQESTRHMRVVSELNEVK